MDIKTLAKMAGVSPATVSRTLNNDKYVAEATRKRILEIVKKVGYKPNDMGRSLRTQQSKKLLLLLPTIRNPFYSEIVNSFENHARSCGFYTLIAVTNRDPEMEKQYVDMVYTRQVDGLASFIPTIGIEEMNKIAQTHPYVAICWRGDSKATANYVCIDNRQAAYDMTQHLISSGHRRIAILNGNFKERVYEVEREDGFLAALREAGLALPPEYKQVCDYGYLDGYHACHNLMALSTPPTAIFAMSDERAVGVIRALNELGLTAGKDVDVVGFDNTDYAQMVFPEITTVEQPRRELGVEAAKLLVELVDHPDAVPRGIILRHRLVLRDSTHALLQG